MHMHDYKIYIYAHTHTFKYQLIYWIALCTLLRFLYNAIKNLSTSMFIGMFGKHVYVFDLRSLFQWKH